MGLKITNVKGGKVMFSFWVSIRDQTTSLKVSRKEWFQQLCQSKDIRILMKLRYVKFKQFCRKLRHYWGWKCILDKQVCSFRMMFRLKNYGIFIVLRKWLLYDTHIKLCFISHYRNKLRYSKLCRELKRMNFRGGLSGLMDVLGNWKDWKSWELVSWKTGRCLKNSKGLLLDRKSIMRYSKLM